MLTIQEFTDEVISILSQRGIESRPLVTVKNNDVMKRGINITVANSRACPVVYLDEIYDKYKSGEYTVESVVEQIMEMLDKEVGSEFNQVINSILNFENCRDKLIVNLVNKKNNTKSLENKIYRDFLDLAIIYKIMLKTSSDVIGTITITNDIMKSWGITEDELFETALKNTENILPIICKDMIDVTENMVKNIIGTEEYHEMPRDLMYVISNNTYNNGAASILYNNCLKTIADKLETDLILIPSSIHEFIVVNPAGDTVDLEYLNELISYVNSTQKETDILSDHYYLYKRDTDEIVM